MDKGRIPHDKASAELCLHAEKSALLELHALIIENNITKINEVTGLINNLVEELDEELE